MAKKSTRDHAPAAPASTSSTGTQATPSKAAAPAAPAAPATAATSKPKAPSSKQQQGWNQVVGNIVEHYTKTTPQRTKLLDAFMAFLVAVGALQFLYCVLAGNYVRHHHLQRLWLR